MSRRQHPVQAIGSDRGERSAAGGLPGVAVILCLIGASVGIAQTPSAPPEGLVPPAAWAFNDIACSSFVTLAPPSSTLRVLGSQDPVIKYMLGPGDTLVISGGAGAGLQPGQEYFVRRISRIYGAKGPDPEHPLSVHTAGWVRILAVDTAVATATIVHACDGILLDDYLEPYVPPLIAAQPESGGSVHYEEMGRVLMADESGIMAGVGQFISVDRGSDHGIVSGVRFFVYRDKRGAPAVADGKSEMFRLQRTALPLVEIGEVEVVSVRPQTSTVRVIAARDAVQAGDFVAIVR